MESSWSRNVTDEGFACLGLSLCSRMLILPDQFLTNLTLFDGTVAVKLRFPLDTDEPLESSGVDVPPTHPHFPYGFAVDPDVPL